MTVGELKVKLSADVKEFDKGIDVVKNALENMETKSKGTTQKVSGMIGDIAENIRQSSPAMADAGAIAFGAIDDGVPAITEGILSSVQYIMDRIISSFNGYNGQMTGVGAELMQGIGIGIIQSSSYLKEQVQTMGESVIAEIGNVFEIASPSRKTMYLGEMIGEGLAVGIAQSLGKVEISAGNMYQGVMDATNKTNNTYNTYNSTYNGKAGVNDSVSMADFENRIRRAYV